MAMILVIPFLAVSLLFLRLVLGRNLLVSNALGIKSFGGVKYLTTAENITGLLAPGSVGYVACSLQFCQLTDCSHGSVNHGKPACKQDSNMIWNAECPTSLGVATDGITTLLRVTIQ